MQCGQFLTLLCILCAADCARILAVLPTNTRSHYAVYEKVLAALARRNHDVTIVSHFSMKNPPANVDEISVAGTIPDIANDLSTRVTNTPEFMRNLEAIMRECVQACDAVSKFPAVKSLLNTTQLFDLLIVEVFGSECFLPFAFKFDIPVVGLLSSVPLPWVNEQLGNPEATSYVPSYMMGFGQKMSLWERIQNTLATTWAKIAYYYQSQIPSQVIAEKLFGPIPSLRELARNYSLVLSNSHFSINDVRPLVPGLVEVGGLHLTEKQTLPKDLQSLLDRSKRGVIYWSFGSMSRIETIPEPKLKQIMDVFRRLPYTFIVKMDVSVLSKNVTIPANVHTRTWTPQYGTLCHPNLKLFIAHGGLLGTQEAVACGVPMLIMPLYADQALNARAMEDRGVAKVLQFDSVNSFTLKDSITELLNDSSYKQKAEELSSIFMDRPVPPLDTSVYWIEYVLRHKGAKHLRSPAHNLSKHEYILLDVIAICLAVSLVIFLCTLLILKRIFRFTLRYTSMDEPYLGSFFRKTSFIIFLTLLRHCNKLKTN